MGTMWMILTVIAATSLFSLAFVLLSQRHWIGGLRRAEPAEVVVDLDAVVTRTVAFRFQGRSHMVPPLTVQQFVTAMNAMAHMDQLRQKKKLSEAELLDGYEQVFSTMCPTLKRRDVERMSHTQIAALFNLVTQIITGKADLTDQKKSAPEPNQVKAATIQA